MRVATHVYRAIILTVGQVMTFLRRSFLFVPGNNTRAIEKARSLASDAVIFDLEDAVAPARKVDARAQVADAIAAAGFANREILVRINGLTTEWGADDLSMVAKARPHGIVIPKVSDRETLIRTTHGLGDATSTQLWPMIETPLGVLEVRNLSAFARDSATRLAGFIVGTNDIARETGARQVPGRLPLLMSLSQCVFSAKAFGFCAIDGVYNNFKDFLGFEAECIQARDLGFDGKTLIHPDQIRACNASFTPSEREVNRARAIVLAFETESNRDSGAVQLNGEMIELLHLDMARRTIAAWHAPTLESD